MRILRLSLGRNAQLCWKGNRALAVTTVFSASGLGLSCVSTVCLVTGGQEAPKVPAGPLPSGQSSCPRRWPGFRGDGWVWWQKRPQRPQREERSRPAAVRAQPQLGGEPWEGLSSTTQAQPGSAGAWSRGLDHDDDYAQPERSRGRSLERGLDHDDYRRAGSSHVEHWRGSTIALHPPKGSMATGPSLMAGKGGPRAAAVSTSTPAAPARSPGGVGLRQAHRGPSDEKQSKWR